MDSKEASGLLDKSRYDRYLSREFQSVIMQPTTLCNMGCHYCYLPFRLQRREMAPAIAALVAESIDVQDSRFPVDVVWHGGEPLAMRPRDFGRLLEYFEPLRTSMKVRHFVQTNATMINDSWCDVFQDYGFQVGVSIDGPECANMDRVDWIGNPAFGRIMRGIRRLKERGIPFSAICVVTPETVRDPAGVLAFFENLGADRVGFNIEEQEGPNNQRAKVDALAARGFWRAVFRRSGAGTRFREYERILGYLAQARAGRKSAWISERHDPIPTVSYNGDVSLLSPELAGTKAPEYGDFIVGNIRKEKIPAMLTRAHEIRYVDEFLAGVDSCRSQCEFFGFCRGGQAGNKYFELGAFTGTETAHCRNSKQELARALEEHIKENSA